MLNNDATVVMTCFMIKLRSDHDGSLDRCSIRRLQCVSLGKSHMFAGGKERLRNVRGGAVHANCLHHLHGVQMVADP